MDLIDTKELEEYTQWYKHQSFSIQRNACCKVIF